MHRYFLLFLPLLLIACAAPEEEDTYVERPLSEIYRKAQADFAAGNYEVSAEEFEEVERQHPHSRWAVRAQVMAAYVYFSDGKYTEAELTLDRFIELNPSSEFTAYAYYLKAMTHYYQITDIERDQGASYQALQGFEQVLARYGDSIYAQDARLKRDLVQDHLAGKEIEVGLYYLRKDEYGAAINRFRTVVNYFSTTTHVPEALGRLVETYVAMGIYDEAIRTASVLQYNYPKDYWYEYAHNLLADVGAVQRQSNPTRDWSGYDSRRKKKWLASETIAITPPPFADASSPLADKSGESDESDDIAPQKNNKTLLQRFINWF